MTPGAVHRDRAPLDPLAWWRTPCFVTERLVLCGDLDTWDPQRGKAQLEHWAQLGVGAILDVRDEACDRAFVARHAPGLAYHWVGTHDEGGGQPDSWFDAGVEAARRAGAESRTLLVHCHMGVNRAPSMLYAILLSHGHHHIEAIEQIRAARPIAAALYAHDALAWWQRASGVDHARARGERDDLRRWLADHPVDGNWIVSRIARGG